MVNYNWPDTAATNHPSDPHPRPEDMAKVIEVVFGAYRPTAVDQPIPGSGTTNVEGQSPQADESSPLRTEL